MCQVEIAPDPGQGTDQTVVMEQNRLKPTRGSLHRFPDVVQHAGESSVKRHEQFRAAKAGDPVAANRLATQLISAAAVEQISSWVERKPAYLVPIHALEAEGVNEIPAALATELSGRLGLPVNRSIVQVNSVGHTGADGYTRLANQAIFDGAVREGRRYVVVDDFVGQGGTLANLIGYIRSLGGKVLGATVLTGKPYSAKLALESRGLQALRSKHGAELETWWSERFGFGFDRLTRSEARYLENSPDADTIRNRIIAAGPASHPTDSGPG